MNPETAPSEPQPKSSLNFAARSSMTVARQSAWAELFTENPMLDEARREQRRFFRSAGGASKAARIIIFCLVGLFYLWLILQAILSVQDLTQPLAYLQLILLTLILPGSVYGAISGERERSTWEALILTRLTPAQIIAGKLAWRVRLILIVSVLLLLPLITSRIQPGRLDATPMSLFAGEMVILTWGFLLCTFGLWVSAMTQRSIATLTVIVISLLGALIALPCLYMMFAGSFFGVSSASSESGFVTTTILNPFVMLNEILTGKWDFNAYHQLGQQLISGWQLCVAYLALSAALIVLTNRKLHQLNHPQTIKAKQPAKSK